MNHNPFLVPTTIMAAYENQPSPDTGKDLPLVLLHHPRTVTDASMFTSPLQNRVRFLSPLDDSDSSFSTLSGSIRLMVAIINQPVDSQVLDKYPSLECIVGTVTGLDHIDLTECYRRGIRVTNAGEAFCDAVAEYAIGLLIDVLRGISAADRFVRAGSWPAKEDFPLGSKVSRKRVGIVGLGNIGIRIGKILEAFGCSSIAYNSRRKKPKVPYPYYEDIHELACNVDILFICCALNKETHHIINRDVLAALGKKGVIINIGRGALIDEKELVRLLVRGEIGGAGLDVFEDEPFVPKELYGLDNVVLSPHRSGALPESFVHLQEIVVGNIEAFFANKPLLSEVELCNQ